MERAEIAEAYASQGYFFPLDAIPPSMAQDAARRIDALAASPPRGLAHPWNIKTHLLADWVFELTTYPAVLDAVEAVLGPNILMQAADVFLKPPHGAKHVNWHQDANYWGFDPFDLVTAWIALTDATPANGCMRYLPGSHGRDKLAHAETFAEDSALTRGQEIVLRIDENDAVSVILKPGQMTLHHCLLAHASGPNTTGSPRIGLAVRFLPTHVRQTGGPPMSAILVRGRDDHGHFATDPAPSGAFDAAALAAHDRAMRPHADSNYATA
ncbi:MAG TPA: phytanoyl-CoA dioxygenase family protein [Pseudomonadales bacterium]|jgi:ectoine hydroxylase-related dioxygenase (phytanoyl-CoA dioxygenase family)